ncbi:ATP-grasp domain-containing protein [Pontibacillus salipaludis]|uniref:Alpha-L-glutamate ligase n=1 Tax=Pontibacillus salipaludis TaxID=1697394 RepID=A0ABQ1PTW7_9BACI|nr:ATP-grasp domain-containing protein [Pontibacillus salipaludis]GGD03413.1 alpha-L-glutamate ligase [Pontibacillus salipaludis]
MNGWLIYSDQDADRNQAFIKWMIEEAAQKGLQLTFVPKEKITIGIRNSRPVVLLQGEEASLPSFAIIRTIDSMLTLHFEELGVKTFNSSHVSEICNNKWKTHQYLAPHDIPMMETFFLKGVDFNPTEAPLPYPYIIKKVDSRGGKDVHWIDSVEEASELAPTLKDQDLILQQPAPILGKDLRVFVVGQEIVAAILRESSSNFKANYTLGGSARLYPLSPKETAHIERIISLFSFGMVGIDFLFDEEGNLLLNEIEDVVGSRTLSAKSSINIVENYMNHIYTELKNSD